jgi:ubiquinone/menaquinone biosynthesis C-methylase UbiE
MPSVEWNKTAWTGHFRNFKSTKEIPYYGADWGVLEGNWVTYFFNRYILRKKAPGNLSVVVKKYIRPYIDKDKTVVEIGSGGGRWTKYLLEANELVLVELNSIFFPYLKERFPGLGEKMRFYHTSGYEMEGIASDSIDFLFTFGTFVHIEPDGIFTYLAEIRRVLKQGATAVVQYADKTKRQARKLKGFSDMNSVKMEKYIREWNLKMKEHNTRLLNHSNISVLIK